MHVLVATDGNLDPSIVADFATPLATDGGRVTVLTVIEIPRRLLSDLKAVMGQPNAIDRESEDAEYVEVLPEVAVSPTPPGWPGDDAVISRYLEDKCVEYTKPVADEIRARSVNAEGIVIESENTAQAIMDYAAEHAADLIVIGSHGLGAFEGLLGSVGTKIVRRSRVPVLLIRVR